MLSQGLLAFLLAWTVYIFGVTHDPHFAPEVGPTGTYVIFGAVFSVFYLLDFIFLAIPCFFLLARRITMNLVLRILIGVALSGVSVPIWSLVFTTSIG